MMYIVISYYLLSITGNNVLIKIQCTTIPNIDNDYCVHAIVVINNYFMNLENEMSGGVGLHFVASEIIFYY